MSLLLPEVPGLITESDCLSVLRQDLRQAGWTVDVCDADAREAWLVACADLLRQVPDLIQRYCWAVSLAQGWLAQGVPGPMLVGELLHRAEGW